MLLNLWVRDKTSGTIHQVGTDKHDSIEYLDGQVVYTNMQSSASTFDDYEFIKSPDLDDYVNVTIDELWLNSELIHKDLMKKLTQKKGSNMSNKELMQNET